MPSINSLLYIYIYNKGHGYHLYYPVCQLLPNCSTHLCYEGISVSYLINLRGGERERERERGRERERERGELLDIYAKVVHCEYTLKLNQNSVTILTLRWKPYPNVVTPQMLAWHAELNCVNCQLTQKAKATVLHSDGSATMMYQPRRKSV